MSAIREFGRRLKVLLKPGRVEDEINEEMRFHIEMLAKDRREAGLNDTEALYAANRQFGNPGVLKERSWDEWGWSFLDTLAQDMRHAFRTIVRSPAQTLLIVTTLGMAMAANLAVFSLLDKLVFRPLPVEKPSELVLINAMQPEPRKVIVGGRLNNKMLWSVDYPLYRNLRDQVRVFQGMSAHRTIGATLATGEEPVSVKGFSVTGNYFNLLGIKAQLGRVLTPVDDVESDGDAPVVLTHGFWQRQFGGDPFVLNRTIRLNSRTMVVVGITPPGFTGTVSGWNADFFVPLNHAEAFWKIPGFKYDAPGYDLYTVMARLAPGVDILQAEKATDKVYQQLMAEALRNSSMRTDEERARWLATHHVSLLNGGYASSASPAVIRDIKTPLKLLMAMVALVIFVAAGNVSNLLLARGTARARATAIRFALGSSRWRILRELLGESLILSASAAVLGYFLASWAGHLVPVLLNISKLPEGVSTDPGLRSDLFAIGLALVIGVGIWGASAIRATKRSFLPALIENAATGGTPRATYWRRSMVVVQITFSLILLCASFVLYRSLMNLMSVNPGFSVDNLYSFFIDYTQSGYKGVRAEELRNQIADRAQAIPGVRMVAMTDMVPFSGGANIRHVNDRPIPRDDKGTRSIIISLGPDYFKTMGVPLIAGREFTDKDKTGTGKIAVVNESLARILFGSVNPIGRRIWVGGENTDREIVGMVKDMKSLSLRNPDGPSLYLPVSQEYTYLPLSKEPMDVGPVNFVLRTEGPIVTLNDIRAAVKQVDPSLRVAELMPLSDRVSELLYRDRALALLSLCFAGLASLLCAIGELQHRRTHKRNRGEDCSRSEFRLYLPAGHERNRSAFLLRMRHWLRRIHSRKPYANIVAFRAETHRSHKPDLGNSGFRIDNILCRIHSITPRSPA